MIPTAIDRPTILVVDDTPVNLSLLNGFLGKDYRILLANHGTKALQLAQERHPDLILLDIMMPDLDGYEVCRRLKADEALQRIPVLFLTAKTETEDEEQGFAVGAVDFIHKPISLPIVAARVRSHLQLKAWQDFLLDQNAWLLREVEKRLSDINRFQDASILTMVSLAEFRDECTGNHIQRTQEYVRLLAQQLAHLPRYQHQLTSSYIELMAKSAALHDVGKIAIPDHILLKPGKLTDEEFVIMRTHAVRGYEMLARAGEHLGEHGEFLKLAKDIAHYHHEKWDGCGYPDGLQGHAIPLAARLMAVADVFDALLTRRPYKEPLPMPEVVAMIKRESGQHFDPEVIEAFVIILPQLEVVAQQC
ncbi:two-component system response regulator [Chromatium okenii]|uniref:response regulator n=1 Tax=Chromatium okenii TaxID=61644 RepID=UPI0019048B80|nr:two-component system response regulator [Chromatium okenii]MBK1640624.1 two-component system response regulator [Chromatium okenii]